MKDLIFKTIVDFLNKFRIVTMSFGSIEYSGYFDDVTRIKSETDYRQQYPMAIFLMESVVRLRDLEGEIAEVGVYTGGDAKLICMVKPPKKELHLFDTFEGLPEPQAHDCVGNNPVNTGMYKADFDDVKKYLKDESNVFIYKGVFPETSEPINDKKFSLVHLDTDLDEGTYEGLKFFYPRMVKNGMIIVDDYMAHNGVKAAVDRFSEEYGLMPVINYCNLAVFVK